MSHVLYIRLYNINNKLTRANCLQTLGGILKILKALTLSIGLLVLTSICGMTKEQEPITKERLDISHPITAMNPIAIPVIFDKDTYFKRREELTDSRSYLMSCFDLAGTDGADDWMFSLVGSGDKYQNIGLNVLSSAAYNTNRVGSLLWSFKINDQIYNQWGNIDCDSFYPDRAVLSTSFWRSVGLSLTSEILVLAPGCCYISFTFKNVETNGRAVTIAPEVVLQGNDNIGTPIHENKTITEQTKFSIITDINNLKPATLNPKDEIRYEYYISVSSSTQKAQSYLDKAKNTNLEDFRTKQIDQVKNQFISSFPDYSDRQLAAKVYSDLRGNIMDYKGNYFSAPNRIVHKGQWLWDTCFHALVWDLFDNKRAVNLIRYLLNNQNPETGYIVISNTHHKVVTEGERTQPPLIAWAVDRITDNKEDLDEFYPKLKKYYLWLENNRKLENGLYRWKSGGESGMDNSPRFDPIPGIPPTSETFNLNPATLSSTTAHIDLSAMMALFASSMASIAKKTGRFEEVEYWDKKHSEIKTLVNDLLYDKLDGFYYDREISGEWHRVKTVASFWPLTAGIAEPEMAKSMAAHAMNPEEFFTPMPIPTVAANDPTFCFNYWRGPVWINTSYAALIGLKRMGYEEEAKVIGHRVVNGIKTELIRTGHLWEMYDPYAGPAYSMHKKRVGPKENSTIFAGWTGCVLNIMKEIL